MTSLTVRVRGGGGLLEFGEDEADSAYDVVRRGFVGCEREELDGKVAGPGAEDETAFVEVDEAEEEGRTAADSVERGLVGAVWSERVVVPIEHGDSARGDERIHCGGLLGVGADGEETLPMGVFCGRAGAVVVEARGGDLDGFDDGGGGDAGFVHCGGGRDDGDDLGGIAGVDWEGRLGSGQVYWQELVDGEVLRGEDAVEAFEGKATLAIEEIGDMRLLEASLMGEAAAGESAAFDASKEFDAEEFMQILKIHGKGVSMANHIIRQDEDKAKFLLYAIRFNGQDADRW
jgi:hypothetical protein